MRKVRGAGDASGDLGEFGTRAGDGLDEGTGIWGARTGAGSTRLPPPMMSETCKRPRWALAGLSARVLGTDDLDACLGTGGGSTRLLLPTFSGTRKLPLRTLADREPLLPGG